MAYIEDRIDCLEDRLCKLERQLENRHLEDRVSTLEDIIEADGEKLDALREEHEALVEGVRYLRSQIIHDKPQVQQTTEEFVRIVRCKDCKWYTNDILASDNCTHAKGLFIPCDNDYCSKGEQK